MIEVNENYILESPYQILLDLQAELKYNNSNLLHIIKPPRNNHSFLVSCPVHKHGNEQHPSASVTLQEIHKNNKTIPAGFLYCFTCKTKMYLDNLISFCFGKNDNGAYGRQWLLDHYMNFEVETRQNYFKKLQEKEIYTEQQYISEEELDTYRYIHPYMYKRGLTDSLIEKYDIGYQKDFRLSETTKPFECITFPVRDINGRCIFVARRAIKHKLYNYSKNTKKAIYGLYEANKYHPDSKELFICESMLNAITLEKYGFPAIALLGTGSQEQYKELKSLPYRKYNLFLDGDTAGQQGTYKLLKALESTHLLLIYKIIDKGVDINDLAMLDKEEFMKHIIVQTKEEFMYDYSKNESTN